MVLPSCRQYPVVGALSRGKLSQGTLHYTITAYGSHIGIQIIEDNFILCT